MIFLVYYRRFNVLFFMKKTGRMKKAKSQKKMFMIIGVGIVVLILAGLAQVYSSGLKTQVSFSQSPACLALQAAAIAANNAANEALDDFNATVVDINSGAVLAGDAWRAVLDARLAYADAERAYMVACSLFYVPTNPVVTTVPPVGVPPLPAAVTGACLGVLGCSEVSPTDCNSSGTTFYYGDNTTCTPAIANATGACTKGTICSQATFSSCKQPASANGSWYGPGTSCP